MLRPLALCVVASLAAALVACPAKDPPAPPPVLAAYAEGATVHVVEALSQKPVHTVQVADDVVDLAWTSDGRVAALTRAGAVLLVRLVDAKAVAQPVTMPAPSAWGSGPTNVRLVAHLEEQKPVHGDHGRQFGSDPYPSMAKLVRMESGDVELVSCQFYDKATSGVSCQDWVWSTLDTATSSFGRVSAAGPAYQDPDEHAAPDERQRVRPPSRAAPLRAPAPLPALPSTSR